MRSGSTGEVRLVRGALVESVHRVHVAVVDPAGALLARAGDAEVPVVLRSAAKPFQALPLLADGAAEALAFTPEELALACGSHGGEPRHVATVRATLARLGLTEDALACGAHAPLHAPSARALAERGEAPGRVHNNCSGKHVAMLALALHHGWPLEGYEERGHPVQRRMAAEVARWTGVPEAELGLGVDGCGVVCFSAPLASLARGYARLLEEALAGEGAAAGPRRLLEAVWEHPFQVAGTDRPCTALLAAGPGRTLVKVGAEGVYAAALRLEAPADPDASGEGGGPVVGIALKVEDGARRAAEVALVAVLDALGRGLIGGGMTSLPAAFLAAGTPWRRPPVRNTLGAEAAYLEAELALLNLPAGVPARSSRAGALRPGFPSLVRAAAAQAAGDAAGLEAELRDTARAVAAGALDRVEVEEALLQSYLFLGYPSALEALRAWHRVHEGNGVEGVVQEPSELWASRGRETFARVYGRQVQGLERNVAGLHPDLARWMVEEGYGKVLGRPGLALADRELLVSAILAVQAAPRQLHSHLRGALRNGASPEAIEEMLHEIDPWMERAGARRLAMERWDAVRQRAGLEAGVPAPGTPHETPAPGATPSPGRAPDHLTRETEDVH
jgi:L-asparaginase II/alkylhydroperoxidase/carboxymuconolactone decarboxylase family protein YurZ